MIRIFGTDNRKAVLFSVYKLLPPVYEDSNVLHLHILTLNLFREVALYCQNQLHLGLKPFIYSFCFMVAVVFLLHSYFHIPACLPGSVREVFGLWHLFYKSFILVSLNHTILHFIEFSTCSLVNTSSDGI